MTAQHYNAYIDEAGDEGFTTPEIPHVGSSEWLVLAAVIVAEEDDLALSQAIDTLRHLLRKPPPRPLHFRKLRQHGAKRAAMAELAKWPFVFSVVAVHKPRITSAYLRNPPYLYNYSARLLVERLSWYADDRGRKLRLFFENRASTSYDALQNYMQWIQNDADCTIRRDCIVSYQPVEATRKLAQVADFYASATAAALEPDQYGMPTEDYLMRVKHQLYREPGKSIQSYGFKVFPNIDPARYPWVASL